jgi:hypothetical protein
MKLCCAINAHTSKQKRNQARQMDALTVVGLTFVGLLVTQSCY